MNSKNIVITTDRLVLKVIDEEYANRVLEYFIRNKEFLQEWEPIKDKNFYTEKFHYEQLKVDQDRINNGEAFRVWLFKKEDLNFKRIIGSIGISNIVRGCFHSCHLGYKLDKDEVNKGFLTEALETLIPIVFDEMQLHRIEANIMPRNVASLRVVEKLGFYHEGLAIRYLKINGKWEDHIHMVLRNEAME